MTRTDTAQMLFQHEYGNISVRETTFSLSEVPILICYQVLTPHSTLSITVETNNNFAHLTGPAILISNHKLIFLQVLCIIM